MGGGVDTDEVFYNFDGTKVTKLKVKIEKPGNYGLACIDGDISTKKPTIIDWGNGNKTTMTMPEYNGGVANTTYSEPGKYEISIDGWYDNFRCGYKGISIGVSQISEVLTEIIQVSSLMTNFDSTFSNCSKLTSIPSGLFDNNTKVISFSSTFDNCSSLKRIPPGLFDKNVDAINFDYTFSNCQSLTIIPSGLFDNSINVVDFGGTFRDCSNIKEIPSGLFDNNTKAKVFQQTFYNCSSLTSIPTGLFDKNTSVIRFNYVFGNCTSLIGETPYTLLSNGTKIKLWNRNGTNGFAKPITTKAAFNNCTTLDDYNEIPGNWK